VVGACGRQPVAASDASPVNDSSPPESALAPDAPAADSSLATAVPPGTCGAPNGPVHIVQNERLLDLLQGTWRLCLGEAPVGSPADQGLMVEGKQWFSMVMDADGALVRRNGFDAGGTIVTPNPRQANFELSDGASYIALPSFTDSPRRMRMGGALAAVYERIP
jgi:hypothetical protein